MAANLHLADIPPAMNVPALYLGKIEARRHLLVGVGVSTATYFCDLIRRTEGIDNAVVFQQDHPLVESIVTRYFALSVAGFKVRHEFPADDRINNAKIAALMIKRCLDDGSKRLFQLDRSITSEKRQSLINGVFLYRLFMTIVEATPDTIAKAIPDKKLRKMIEQDVRLCLTREYEVSEEWLAVTALAYSIHYGTPKVALA